MSTFDTDLSQLYRLLSRRLEWIVRSRVRAADAVIEDACQYAWGCLVHHRDDLRHDDAILSWLATTAVREACRLLRGDQRERSLAATTAESIRSLPDPHDLIERRERLDGLARLPNRQQRLLWLQGMGLDYREMAVHEGCTPRTVQRQLLRGRAALRRAA